MSLQSQFKRGPSPATSAIRPTQAPTKSKYAGIKAATPRAGLLNFGYHQLECVNCEEGYNPQERTESYKMYFRIIRMDPEVETDRQEPGLECIVPIGLTGKGADMGFGRLKAFMMALAGFEDEAGYDQWDPEGEFIAASAGIANRFSTANPPVVAVGRRIECLVTRGKPTADGRDYYREYQCAPLADDAAA